MRILITLLVLGIVLCNVVRAEEIEIPDDIELEEEDEELLRAIEDKEHKFDMNREGYLAEKIAADLANGFDVEKKPLIEYDPCEKIHCSAGRICQAEGSSAKCICIPHCPDEEDPRRKVCTSMNETWPSDCELHRQRCLCDEGSKECKGPEYRHLEIEYFGACRDMPPCSEEEMVDFPRRMRDWLFNVMRDLADRKELPQHYLEMELEAENNQTRRWTNAAVWKWCDLDGDVDRSVSKHELFPIRAPLMALEHCIAPFLDTCDPNNDHRITLQEWAKCLELEEADMEERCADIKH